MTRPFRSPLAAQVWFELRRSFWFVPFWTGLLTPLILLIVWLNREEGDRWLNGILSGVAAYLIVLAFLGACIVQGARSRIVGFRSTSGDPGYDLLQPMTVAQLVSARTIASATAFMPTFLIVAFLHFALTTGSYLVLPGIDPTLSEAYSLREMVWAFFSRSILIGLAAWTCLAVGLRVYRWTVPALLAPPLLVAIFLGLMERFSQYTVILIVLSMFTAMLTIGAFAYAHRERSFSKRSALLMCVVWLLSTWVLYQTIVFAIEWTDLPSIIFGHAVRFFRFDTILIGVAVVVAVVTLAVFAYAHRERLLSTRSVNLWGIVWLVSTWVLYRTTVFAIAPNYPDFAWHATAGLVALGWAALIPLPYASALMDVRRRRHSATPPQRVDSGGTSRITRTLTPVRVAAAATAIFLILLTLPVTPAFERDWRNRGYPMDLEALDTWYPAVAEDENPAPEYVSIGNEQTGLSVRFWQSGNGILERKDGVYVVGRATTQRGEPLDETSWNSTEQYWKAVTAQVAPKLKEVASRNYSESRYPIVLQNSYWIELPHVIQLRPLAYELSLDSLHWTIAGKQREAVESALAIFPLAHSLAEEPLLTSQFIRVTLLRLGIDSIQDILSRSELDAAELTQIQEALISALPPREEGPIVNRGIVGDITMGLNYGPEAMFGMGSRDREAISPTWMAWRFMYPTSVERLVRVIHYDNMRRYADLSWLELRGRTEQRRDMGQFDRLRFISPVAAILFSAYDHTYEREWRLRTNLDLARTAVAVEQHRVATGNLPESLEELVPAFLSKVPEDYFGGAGVPIRYIQHDDSGFVVYSVGQDMKDDLGKEKEKFWVDAGDLTFTVAPLAFRTGPQIQTAQTE